MTTDNERIAELEARNERLEHEYQQWSSSLATLHADLDAVGIEGADYRTCNDPTCNSKIVHRVRALLAILKRKSAALEEAKRALRFVCHECDVDDVRTRPACWDALARIESLEHGKTNDA